MRTLMIVAVACWLSLPAFAQSPEPAQVEPPKVEQPKPAAEPPQDQPTELPSLDELLGITNKPSGQQDRTRQELEERLSSAQIANEFQQAVALMGEAATRLQKGRDTGLGTQRIQEDVIRKLDQLIEAARQQQQQQQQQSRSSSRQQRNQQQPNQPQNQQQAGDVENMGEANPPAREDAQFSPDVAPNQASWGSLPERMRDALRQAGDDRFSSLYKSLTEAYYRRLAEEAGR